MRSLVVRVALMVALSLVASFATVYYTLEADRTHRRADFVQSVAALGLDAIRDDLAAAPEVERDAVLATWSPRIGYPVERLARPVPADDIEPDGDGFLVLLRVDDRETLAIGPVGLPSPGPLMVLPAVGGIAAIVLLAALGVTLPITRRLAKMEAVSRRLREGHLDARVEASTDDVIGRLGVSFNHMAEALQRRVLDREELLQAVAHEYGTPLARLSFELELLDGGSDRHARVAAMRADVAELGRLTDELVEWLRADAPTISTFDVREALASVVAAEVPRAALVATDGTRWLGDPRQFRRAIGNLARNAARHARDRVEIAARLDGAALVVTVDDDGPGVPEAERERVFEPFVRVEGSRDRADGGTGLGLAIVRRIVDRHGGNVTVGESPLGGARFTVRWPPPS